jgi:geranylgeranylglycerol-phosphate geranylgeranyltransferase
MDVIGDELRSSNKHRKRKNKTHALLLSGVIFIIFIILSFLPFLMGWLGYVHLHLIVVTDLCISYLSSSLILSNTIEEGRIQIRRLYLTGGMFVAIFIFANLI